MLLESCNSNYISGVKHEPVQAVVRHVGLSALEELCEDPALAHIKVGGDMLLITLHMELQGSVAMSQLQLRRLAMHM